MAHEAQGEKVALVTGAGSGIGRASALAFAAAGHRVAVADFDPDGGRRTVELVTAAGGEACFLEADISDAEAVSRMVAATVERWGRLDCAHNNVGTGPELGADVTATSEEMWDRVIGVNLKGAWLCIRAEIPAMLAGGGGAIVNTGSALSQVAVPDNAAYVAAKHGLLGLTRAAALDTAKQGIRVNAVLPGLVETPMGRQADAEIIEKLLEAQPTGRLARPEEVAAAAVWLCSEAASMVTGHGLAVDGGYLIQ